MAGKAKAPMVAYCGVMGFVPFSDGVGSSKRGRNKSFELENTTKTAIKNYGGGVSTKFTQKQKATDFYDKRSENHGGVMEFVPCSSGVGSSKRGRNKSFELENTTKTAIKNYGGGVSTKFTQKQKAGEFYDKRSGNHGFKKEVKYESSVKFDDKIHGHSTEYQTQVKFKKVTACAHKGPPKTSNKRIQYNKY